MSPVRHLLTGLLVASCLLTLVSCATYRSGLEGTGAASSTGVSDYDTAVAVWTAERGTKEGLKKAIDLLEAVVAADATHQDALVRLSRSYYFMADGYTDDDEAKKALFETGITYGEQAMEADAAFKAQLDKGAKKPEAVSALQKDDQMAI
ncbi:MAG: hypothetical protein VX498_05435, partial [Myxococcota bacterium]|nr:hypothetical protein [Myxococcota bacterium]